MYLVNGMSDNMSDRLIAFLMDKNAATPVSHNTTQFQVVEVEHGIAKLKNTSINQSSL